MTRKSLSTLRIARLMALIAAIGLVPLAVGIVVIRRSSAENARVALDQALTSESRDRGAALDHYFERARSVILLTAHNPAFAEFYALPGAREERILSGGPVVKRVERALAYLEQLYPESIGEACFIDRSGSENARAVRGEPAPVEDLANEPRNPFFGPTFALRPGAVYQAKPYVSQDTGEWVVSNSTIVPTADGIKHATVHFEVTVESFRRAAATSRRRVYVVDAKSGAVVLDSNLPQRVKAPLGRPGDRRFSALAGRTGHGVLSLDDQRIAYRRLPVRQGNANDWIVVVESDPVAATTGFGGTPLAILAVGLGLIGFGVARRWVRLSNDLDDRATALELEEFERLRVKAALAELVQQVGRAAETSRSERQLLERTIGYLCLYAGWPLGHVFLPDENGTLVDSDIWHVEEPARFRHFRKASKGLRLPLGEGLPGRAAKDRAPVWVANLATDRFFVRRDAARQEGIATALAIPIVADGELVAVLELFTTSPVARDKALLDLAGALALQLSHVIERKRAADAAHEADARYRRLVEQLPLALYVDGPSADGTFWNGTYVSPQIEVLLGHTSEQWLSMPYSDAIHPEDRNWVIAAHEDVYATHEDFDHEYRLLHRDGTTVWVRDQMIFVRDEHGKPLFAQGYLLDITRRKEYEAQLDELLAGEREQNEQLRELDRLKDEFVALVSHELRTPLTSIRGYLELVLDGAPEELTDEQRQFLSVVERNADRLQRLVGDLLFVAQVDAGRLALELDHLDAAEVGAEAVEAARPAADQKGLELRLVGDPQAELVGDRARLAQLVDNLVSNAIKFTPAGGHVEVAVRNGGGNVTIEVTDSGMGISAEEQQRLFQRFYRTAAATSQAIPGTGLGLSISKAIVDAHEGTIELESAEGHGTTFRITIPAHINQIAEAA
ncbi:MAG: ATP-binding protein [Actinomycetota bacterium]